MKRLAHGALLTSACALTSVLSLSGAAEAGALSINNAGFETDLAPAVGATGWSISSGGTDWFTTTAGAPDSANDPAAAAGGVNWLSGNRLATGAGASNNPQIIEQVVDISSDAALIDSGDALLDFSFMFSDSDQNDEGFVNVSFFSDVAGTALLAGDLTTGVIAPTAADGEPRAPWALRGLSGDVPSSARSLKIELVINRLGGSAGNAHFDDFSGEITPIPEPAGLAMVALCVGLLGAFRARR
ncbi:hypothetical protein Mal64_30320 [Pseudobythopirellula maris]|uniref:PEP-CTERM protein-sorting domain-containing protein n=1 Tax=Pseudobythopirellula maris TaxID=2527991 RepID=A0A5C5ZM30_9BACT|nr:PEP-CTERM sorting domain-containing protein [Pseudobythopirellula maris]TWT87493.1 hypothetical protein Mal64_30320 [Pseudobythopirellula maris]